MDDNNFYEWLPPETFFSQSLVCKRMKFKHFLETGGYNYVLGGEGF
jgi:hypothetical protein